MEYKVNITEKSIFIGDSPEKAIAAIDYYINRHGVIVATHTEVNREYRGQGLAFLVFKQLIALADTKNAKILPYCSYISEQLAKPEFSSYLYEKF